MIGYGGQGFCYDGRKPTLFQRVAMGTQGSKIVQNLLQLLPFLAVYIYSCFEKRKIKIQSQNIVNV
jgi:hypothetical protein